jgi:hypothetical protein
LTILRLLLRALLLAGRFPWLAFFTTRDGFAMEQSPQNAISEMV